MKFLSLLLAHLSICFAHDLIYRNKFANTKYRTFGATLATSSDKVIVGTKGEGAAPIFIIQPGNYTLEIPPPSGVLRFGLNVAANEHYILTNGAKNQMSWSIFVYSAVHPHKLVTEIPVDNRGFISADISRDKNNKLVIVTETSTVLFYSYDGKGSWSPKQKFNLGKYPQYLSRTVAISYNHAVVGMVTSNGEGEGSVEIFKMVLGVWKRAQTIKSSEYKYFGARVALHKLNLVVTGVKDDNELHVFVYQTKKRWASNGFKWLQEGHLTIPIPNHKGVYSPANFGIDCITTEPLSAPGAFKQRTYLMFAVSTTLNDNIATKIFVESNETWAEYANLKADPMNVYLQFNYAVRFGYNGTIFTGRISPYGSGTNEGDVFLYNTHDLK